MNGLKYEDDFVQEQIDQVDLYFDCGRGWGVREQQDWMVLRLRF